MSDLLSEDILCSSWAKTNPKQEQLYRCVLVLVSHAEVVSRDKARAVVGARATAYSKLLVVGGKYQTTGSQGQGNKKKKRSFFSPEMDAQKYGHIKSLTSRHTWTA